MLGEYTALGEVATGAVAAAVGLVAMLLIETLYVRPMRRSETSTGFSQAEYAGKTGELTTSIAAGSFGEVVVPMGPGGTTFQTAASFTGEPLPDGARVVVVEVAPDGVLHVAPLADDEHAAPFPPLSSRYSTRA